MFRFSDKVIRCPSLLPKCLTSRLISSNRDCRRRIAHAMMSLLHIIARKKTGRLFPVNAMRLDCKKGCQNYGVNACGSSTTSPPEGCRAPTELLPPNVDVIVNGELQARGLLTVVFRNPIGR